MSMTEQTTKTAKPARKKYKARAAAPAQKPSLMAGITVQDCPMACAERHCVISGKGICAHPHKGGLQVGLQNPESLRRLNEAKRILGKAKLDLQGL